MSHKPVKVLSWRQIYWLNALPRMREIRAALKEPTNDQERQEQEYLDEMIRQTEQLEESWKITKGRN